MGSGTKKIKAVYDQKDSLNLGAIDFFLLEETYKNFTRSGINLEGQQKEKLKQKK